MTSPKSLLKGFERVIATAKPDPRRRITFGDPDTRGLFLRITQKGHRSFCVIARSPEGKQIWHTIGDCDNVGLEEARQKAKEVAALIKSGRPTGSLVTSNAATETFKSVLDEFVHRHVLLRKLRRGSETIRIFKTYVEPEWGSRSFFSIRRTDVAALLDKIEDSVAGNNADLGGPVMADRTLAALSKLFSWYAARSDDYVSPIVRGMRRTNSKARSRTRMLSDTEIEAVWNAANEAGSFGRIVQLLLLSAQRLSKVRTMQWSEISDDWCWSITTAEGEKGNAGAIRLPKLAIEVIGKQPRIIGNPFVFAGNRDSAMEVGSKLKAKIDKVAEIAPWTLHDLRRTAKSLMARAGVRPDISERVLGHAIQGVEGVYDQHSYENEKAHALTCLAELVRSILIENTSSIPLAAT